jgi:hypothetical protein
MAYKWLEDRKQQARAEKTQKQNRNFSVMPVSMRYTGSGEDGVVQTMKPTEMYMTKAGPRMVHEGEGLIHNQDGSITVVPQSHLQQMEKQHNIQGYATGGTIPNWYNTVGNRQSTGYVENGVTGALNYNSVKKDTSVEPVAAPIRKLGEPATFNNSGVIETAPPNERSMIMNVKQPVPVETPTYGIL